MTQATETPKRTSKQNLQLGVFILAMLCLVCFVIGLSATSGQRKQAAEEAAEPTALDIVSLKTSVAATVIAEQQPQPIQPRKTRVAAVVVTSTTAPKIDPTKTPTEIPATETQSPPTATPDRSRISQGTHLVNKDITPGLYKITNNPVMCYWARLSSLSGELSAILANDNAIGSFYIDVKATDTALQITCSAVRLETLPAPLAEFPTTLPPGIYLVNRDIKPGTYRGDGEGCYWERTSALSEGTDAIIANNFAMGGQYFAQVSPADFAFKTTCELEWISE
jgi:hypothetical protein